MVSTLAVMRRRQRLLISAEFPLITVLCMVHWRSVSVKRLELASSACCAQEVVHMSLLMVPMDTDPFGAGGPARWRPSAADAAAAEARPPPQHVWVWPPDVVRRQQLGAGRDAGVQHLACRLARPVQVQGGDSHEIQ